MSTMTSQFSLLPEPRLRWKSFGFSFLSQAAAVLLLVNLNLLYPQALAPQTRYVLTHLVDVALPVPQHPQPPPPPRVVSPPQPVPQPAVETKVELPPLPKPHKPEPAEPAPQLKAAPAKLPPLPAGGAPRVIATNLFSTGSSATPTTSRPARQVQTGGLGDPNGLPPQDTHGRPVNINALGSFDLPAGPGRGNGLGGSRGVPGVVVSTGFGNGVATGNGGSGGGSGRGQVRPAGFGDARPPAEEAPRKQAATAPAMQPAEVFYKPKPVYTEEGRRLKVEGDVRLEVIFAASGRVQVVRILQGLGHGLDEAAVRAAEQIKFKPAQRDGHSVDSTATLHIIFQLA